MRPLLLAALATMPALSACTPTCTSESLASGLEALAAPTRAKAAALVAGSCKTDEAFASWLASPDGPPSTDVWASACAGGPDPASLDAAPLVANRAAAFATCDVGSLGIDEPTFVSAAGGHALAIATTRQLMADEAIDDATAKRVGRAMLDAPAFSLPSVTVPRIAVDTAEPPGPAGIVITADQVRVGEQSFAVSTVRDARPAGPTGYGVADLVSAAAASSSNSPAVLEVAADAPASVVRRVAASVGAGGSVDLVVMATVDGKDDRPHRVPIAVGAEPPEIAVRRGPGGWVIAAEGLPLPPVEGCPAPGPTWCDTKDGSAASAAKGAVAASGGKPVGIDLPADAMTDDLVAMAAAVTAAGGTAAFDTRFAPCVDPPDGMVCIPGSDVVVGDGRNAPGDGPAMVTLSTHYVDVAEKSVGEYRACMEAGACGEVSLPRDDARPVERITFLQARELCAYQGKRLPTEWELEQAARPPESGRQSMDPSEAPGDPQPTCELANSARCGGSVKPAGSGAPNGWGLSDVLGNVSEFSASYPKKLSETCGGACAGIDPLGPCDGAPMCKGRLTRIVRGGSYRDGADRSTPAWRSAVRKKTPYAGIGVRCASDGPVLETLPSAWVASPPPPNAAPEPFTEAQRAVMASIDEDAIDEIPECEDDMRGRSRTDCKDPTHYIYPNEDRASITFPWIQNRGGALLGVGSDQNYTYAGIARSELLFLLDYDAIVVHIHRVNQAFIKKAESPDAFVSLWDPTNAAQADEVIAAEWAGDPMMATYKRTRRSLNRIMHRHYQSTRAPNPDDASITSWLRDPALYTWVRNLWLQGRVRSLKGDMLGPNAMQGVGRACTELGIPMRVYYTSNAPNAWGGEMTAGYKANVLSFPMDEQSVVLRALGWTNEFGQTGHWHFNVQDGLDAQERLSRDGYVWLWQVVRPYRSTDDVDLTLSGIQGRWEEAHTDGGR